MIFVSYVFNTDLKSTTQFQFKVEFEGWKWTDIMNHVELWPSACAEFHSSLIDLKCLKNPWEFVWVQIEEATRDWGLWGTSWGKDLLNDWVKILEICLEFCPEKSFCMRKVSTTKITHQQGCSSLDYIAPNCSAIPRGKIYSIWETFPPENIQGF